MKRTPVLRISLVGLVLMVAGGLGLAALAPALVGFDYGIPTAFAEDASSSGASATTGTTGATATTTSGGGSSKDISTPTPIGAVDPSTIIGRIIKIFVGSVGVVALIMFIYAGFLIMTARGNSDQYNKGKGTIIWATIGLIGVFLSYAAVEAVLKALGAN